MHVIEWVTKTVNRDGKNSRHLKSQKINLFQSFLFLWTFNLVFICPTLCQSKTTCLLLMKQKLYTLDAFLIEKLKLSENDPPTDQTLYRTRPLTEIWVVSIEHLRRVWHADRGRLLLRTPGPVPLGLAYVLLVETNPFPNLSLFYRTMLFEYPSVLSRFCI